MKEKPQIWKIILLSLLFLVLTYVVVIAATFLLYLIVKLIQFVPALERIADWILSLIYRNDNYMAGLLVYIIPFGVAYYLTMFLTDKLCGDRTDTFRNVLRVSSSLLFTLNVLFLIVNAVTGSSFRANIIFIIYSIIVFIISFAKSNGF